MENNNIFKEIDIKNCTCYYFDDITKIEDFDFDNILINERSYENILVYNISCKTLIGAKPLCIRFDKVDGFIAVYNGTRYLILSGGKKYDFIYNRVRYLAGVKSGITYIISHNYAKIKVDPCDYLPLEIMLIFYNVIILIKSVFKSWIKF